MIEAFILIVTINFGFGEEQKSFEMRFPKDNHAECLEDAKTFQMPLPMISIETRCETELTNQSDQSEAGIET